MTLYTAAELQAFHGKFENQVILGRARLSVMRWGLDGIFSKQLQKLSSLIFTKFIQLCCVTKVFIVAKFDVTMFSYFSKHWPWLHWIGLMSFEFLITERDSKFYWFKLQNLLFRCNLNIFNHGKVKHELWVQIYKLRVRIHELRVQIHELRVQIHELLVQIHELRIQTHELRV